MIPILRRSAAPVLLLAAAVLVAGCERPLAEPTPHAGGAFAVAVPTRTGSTPATPSAVVLAATEDSPSIVPFPTYQPFPTMSTPKSTQYGAPHPSPRCGRLYGQRPNPHRTFLHWAVNDTRLVFDLAERVATVDTTGTHGQVVADADPTQEWDQLEYTFGYHADVSPDGSMIVYATCEFPEPGGRRPRNHEIAIVSVDGTAQNRLTSNRDFDSYPTWAPDGTRIAFVNSSSEGSYDPCRSQIHTISAGGIKGIPNTEGVGLFPPVWSPDGERLAFITLDEPRNGEHPCGRWNPDKRTLYTIRLNGSELSRIGEVATLPTWSPDGERLAFGLDDEASARVYTSRFDGTDRHEVLGDFRASQVSWSPDGSELLLVSDGGVYVVQVDGRGLRDVGPPPRDRAGVRVRVKDAAWSTDGSMIAVRHEWGWDEQALSTSWGESVFVTGRDGNEVRAVAEGVVEGIWRWVRAVDPPPLTAASCSAGVVVPEPDANPGLVEDCETLLRTIGTLIELEPLHEWNSHIPIAQWPYVDVRGSPPRVRGLSITYRGLRGVIPPELGKLPMLSVLNLDNNNLNGPIPPELVKRTTLTWLSLENNDLSGPIPPGLGNLNMLDGLGLGGNDLSGPIPPELGNLIMLTWLTLQNNNLSGCVPVELSDMWVEASGLPRCKP